MVKGTIVLVKKNNVKLSENRIKYSRSWLDLMANQIVKTKNKVRKISRFPVRDRKINQGDVVRAKAEAAPTYSLNNSLPKPKTKTKVIIPAIAEAALTPNSLAPNIFTETAINQKPTGG